MFIIFNLWLLWTKTTARSKRREKRFTLSTSTSPVMLEQRRLQATPSRFSVGAAVCSCCWPLEFLQLLLLISIGAAVTAAFWPQPVSLRPWIRAEGSGQWMSERVRLRGRNVREREKSLSVFLGSGRWSAIVVANDARQWWVERDSKRDCRGARNGTDHGHAVVSALCVVAASHA